jgi:DNA repair exonuclease
MKIIHCADLHLDSKLTTNLSKSQTKERRMELLQTFERMVRYASKNNIKAIIIAGDMFDTKNVSATARNSVYNAIEKNRDIDFYYLRGNHDVNNFLSSLEVIPNNLKLFDSNWCSYIINQETNNNIIITGIELNADNSNSISNSLVLDTDKFNIVVLHGQDSAYEAKDKTEHINIGAFKNKGIDYLALGHIHTYRQQELDSRGVYCYSGCLEGRGFDETGECGFVVLDIDEKKKTYESSFIPFAFRTLHEKNIDLTGCMTSAEMAEKITLALDKENYSSKSLIKLILKGSIDIASEKNLTYLEKQFDNNYYFIKIYDETTLFVDYNSYALDESLKGEFVRTVNAADHLDEATKAEIIRYGIQALSGEEIE